MNFNGKLTLKKTVIAVVVIALFATVYDYFMEQSSGGDYVPIFESKGFFIFIGIEVVLMIIVMIRRYMKNK